MPKNIEIKAKIENEDKVRYEVELIADSGPEVIMQDDTFFHCKKGRLKVRKFSPEKGELIFYRRADDKGPTQSTYTISPTNEPNSLTAALTNAYGQVGRVQKKRTLFMVDHTRIHLDKVKQLGHFLELEVVLTDGQSPKQGMKVAHRLLDRLNIQSSQLIECAYIDLLG